MPIVLDPGVAAPDVVESVTSADGILTVFVDEVFGGALLQADFSALATDPIKVRFVRDGVMVRSGDPAWAPGGIAFAYDHEVPLGAASSWTAVPIFPDGTVGSASLAAALTVPFDVSDFRTIWLKSITNPGLSLRLQPVLPLPTFTRASSNSFTRIPGSKYPLGTYDKRAARQAEYHFYTDSAGERDALDLLLDQGTLLLQAPYSHYTPDIYCLPGDSSEQPAGAGMDDPDREWVIPFTEVKRPPTIDAPLFIPGHSYGDQMILAPTYAERLAAWPLHEDALLYTGGPGELVEGSGSGDGGAP